jgi:dTMP kinase
VAEAMTEMEARLAESLGRIDSEEIRLQAEQASERALRAAGRAAEQARRVADREAERARLRAERAERRWRRASGRRPRSRQEPATDEERMRVLRLVEEGRVTPEQAADLLAALEGR